MNINTRELAAHGMNLADLARQSGVSYNRIWREATGGLAKGLDRWEIDRLQQVIEETVRQPA